MTGLIILAGSALIAAIPQGAEFGDWSVACDNIRHCEAVAAIEPDGEHDDWTLHVIRGGEADSEPELYAQQAFGESYEVRLVLDGKATPFGFDSEGAPQGNTRQMLSAIAAARTAQVVDTDGEVIGRFPVRGASAALRWIDDRQMRAHTVTALVARGDKPATSVPSLPPLPSVSQPPASEAPPVTLPEAALVALLRQADCEPELAAPEYHRLDDTHTLGLNLCWMGAYQGAHIAFVVDEDGSWKFAPIERWQEPGEDDLPLSQHYVTNAEYRTDRRLLTDFAKYRGLTDCGRFASWAWDGEVFRLASFSELSECRGAPLATFLPRWRTTNSSDPDE